MGKLDNQVVIITGAGKGIGRGIAECFAAEGTSVVIATRGIEDGKRTEENIKKLGGNAYFIQTDVADESSIISMVEQTLDRYGKINTLINNAGVTLFKSILETTIEDWEKVINIDLRGTFLCSKYVVPVMIKQKGGSIINISSNHAISTLPNTEIYAAAKGGVNAMTKSMALSLGQYNIRVNTICPGFTDTPHYRNWISEQADPDLVEGEVKALHALSRICKPEDVAKLAIYLASDESNMMTGESIVLDGGLSSRLYNSALC
jgi:NAD(P)-dependent dehydrogenase (short-subunit alcohol dehydrogenase family)